MNENDNQLGSMINDKHFLISRLYIYIYVKIGTIVIAEILVLLIYEPNFKHHVLRK